jgi:hypothetical protein
LLGQLIYNNRMSTKTVGRIYLRREKDILHILSIKVQVKDGSIYFSMPMSDAHRKDGVDNVKSSYHGDGQTHLTVQVPELKKIADDTKRNMVQKMGFNGDKVYLVSGKNKPLAEIDDVTKVGQGMGFKDINNTDHSSYKVVTFEDIKWGSVILDTKRFTHLTFNYYLIPDAQMNDAAGHVDDEYLAFPHPTLDLYIVVRVFDFWKG